MSRLNLTLISFLLVSSSIGRVSAQSACRWPPVPKDSIHVRVTLVIGRDLERRSPSEISKGERRLRERIAGAIAASFRAPAGPLNLAVVSSAEDYAPIPTKRSRRESRSVRAPIALAAFSLASSGHLDRIALQESSGSPPFDSALVDALWRVDSALVLKGELPEARSRFVLLTGVADSADAGAPALMDATLPIFALREPAQLPGNERPKFPPTSLFLGTEGDVEVSFRVDSSGRADTTTFRIERLPSPELSREVLRVLAAWPSHRQRSRAARYQRKYRFPFTSSCVDDAA